MYISFVSIHWGHVVRKQRTRKLYLCISPATPPMPRTTVGTYACEMHRYYHQVWGFLTTWPLFSIKKILWKDQEKLMKTLFLHLNFSWARVTWTQAHCVDLTVVHRGNSEINTRPLWWPHLSTEQIFHCAHLVRSTHRKICSRITMDPPEQLSFSSTPPNSAAYKRYYQISKNACTFTCVVCMYVHITF